MNKVQYKVTPRQRNGSWGYQIQIVENGKWKYHSSEQGFRLKREAEAVGKQKAEAIEPKTVHDDFSFKEIAILYIKSGNKSESTRETYREWLENLEPIHDKRPEEVTPVDANKVIVDYYEDHKFNGTRSLLGFAKSVFRYAIRILEVNTKNPFDTVVIQDKAGKSEKEISVLSLDEIKVLIDVLINAGYPDIAFLTALMGLGGLRLGEARGMTRKGLLPDKQLIKVIQQRKVENKVKIVTPKLKTKTSKRDIPYAQSIDTVLQHMPTPLSKDTLYVDMYYRTAQVRAIYKKVGYLELRPHELRHSFATNMLERGVDFKTVSDLMGDRVETVMKTYAHVNQAMADNARKILVSF